MRLRAQYIATAASAFESDALAGHKSACCRTKGPSNPSVGSFAQSVLQLIRKLFASDSSCHYAQANYTRRLTNGVA